MVPVGTPADDEEPSRKRALEKSTLGDLSESSDDDGVELATLRPVPAGKRRQRGGHRGSGDSSGGSEPDTDSEAEQMAALVESELQRASESAAADGDSLKPDDYLYCSECGQWREDGCSSHPVPSVPNPGAEAPRDADGRPPLPTGWRYGLRGRGVFVHSDQGAKKGTLLGPLECVTLVHRRSMSLREVNYVWEVRHYTDAMSTYLLQTHTAGLRHNWLAAVRFATSASPMLQNAIAVQFKGKVYYKLIKDVDKGTEILACRGHGLPLTKEIAFNKLLCDKKGACGYLCADCPAAFRSQRHLDAHTAGSRHIQTAGAAGHGVKQGGGGSDVADSSADEATAVAVNEACYPCTRCDAVLHSDRALSRHLTVKHRLSQTAFMCAVCEKVFRRKHHWQRHELAHRTYECTLCGKACTSESSLALHAETAHGQILMERKYACDRCTEKFYTYEQLWAHRRGHDAGSRHSLAERMRRRRAALKADQASSASVCKSELTWDETEPPQQPVAASASANDNDGPTAAVGKGAAGGADGRFECRYCEMSYSKPQARSRHERKKHADEHKAATARGKHLPFACDECGHRLATSHALRYHVLRHARQYSHVCQLCQCGYVLRSELTKHLKAVHGVAGAAAATGGADG